MKKIVITGAAGFIASNLVRRFNEEGITELILVDNFGSPQKRPNLLSTHFSQKIDRATFPEWLRTNHKKVSFIFHLGARTDTTEFDTKVFEELNVQYSKTIWQLCTRFQIPLVYASSAATYGIGDNGFSDEHSLIPQLKPLNPYGESKQLFDLFAINQAEQPPFWAGLKFFNVYGPYEAHKARMASVVYHAYGQIKGTGKVRLFKSHQPQYKDGEQLRDFIYVDDVIECCLFFWREAELSSHIEKGIYNIGTGKACTFNDLVKALFSALNLPPQIEYIPIPEDIRDKYQYFTEAKMEKLLSAGYNSGFLSIEESVRRYADFLLKP